MQKGAPGRIVSHTALQVCCRGAIDHFEKVRRLLALHERRDGGGTAACKQAAGSSCDHAVQRHMRCCKHAYVVVAAEVRRKTWRPRRGVAAGASVPLLRATNGKTEDFCVWPPKPCTYGMSCRMMQNSTAWELKAAMGT